MELLSFIKHFEILSEATLSGGKDAKRHAHKYLEPFVGQEATHTLAKDHGSIQAGESVSIRGHKISNGKHVALVSKVGSSAVEEVPFTKINKPGREAKYSDEHAHARVWNHMVGKGIANDKEAMKAEMADAKSNRKHPLHFSNAPDDGFPGKKKTSVHEAAYYKEHDTAVETVDALAKHKHFKKAVKEKHKAKVMGSETGQVSETWKKHGAGKGIAATSKSDIAIVDPKGKGDGLKLSMKKGGGSQLMSAGPEETKAVHDHAAKEMLETHPKYKRLSKKDKEAVHSDIMSGVSKVTKHMVNMKTADSKDEITEERHAGQKALDKVHNKYPELNSYVRKEATTGQGKFGKDSINSATYLVKSAEGKKGAEVKHVDEVDYEGPKLRVSAPKSAGRPGNVKADEK